MKKFIYSLLIIGLSTALWGNAFAQSCNTFRQCDNLGKAARDAGDLSEAQSYYKKACFMEVKRSLVNLRNNSCIAVTTISGELDSYASAYTFFNKACIDGKDAGCFHLALLENDRGNLQLAMEMMKPLCDRKYIIDRAVHSSGCTEYKDMERTWESQNPGQPRQARDNAIQIPVFVITLLLPLIANVFLSLKQYSVSFILSGLTFISYGYYEYGVSPSANIRIDLLLIFPLLLLSLKILITSAPLLFEGNTDSDNDSSHEKKYSMINTYIPLICGLVLGVLSWAIVSFVSDVFEPFDNELAFFLGQSVLSVAAFYFGYSHGLKYVFMFIIGIYVSSNVYPYFFGSSEARAWAYLGLITSFLFVCIIPLAFGILGKLVSIGKKKYNNWLKKKDVAKQSDP